MSIVNANRSVDTRLSALVQRLSINELEETVNTLFEQERIDYVQLVFESLTEEQVICLVLTCASRFKSVELELLLRKQSPTSLSTICNVPRSTLPSFFQTFYDSYFERYANELPTHHFIQKQAEHQPHKRLKQERGYDLFPMLHVLLHARPETSLSLLSRMLPQLIQEPIAVDFIELLQIDQLFKLFMTSLEQEEIDTDVLLSFHSIMDSKNKALALVLANNIKTLPQEPSVYDIIGPYIEATIENISRLSLEQVCFTSFH
jgi:hypothetical protein